MGISKGSIIGWCCFIFTVWCKYRLFIKLFCWLSPLLRPFVGYFFATSKKKASTISYGTAFQNCFKTMPIYYVRPWPRYQGTLGHFPIRSGAFAGGGTLMEHWVRIPSAGQGKLPSRGRAGCGNGLRTGNYGRPGKASTNSMVISGSASTN